MALAEDTFLCERKTGAKGLFIATAEALDDEMRERIEIHKAQRGDRWHCIEEPISICDAMRNARGNTPVILIDCLTMWLSNMLFSDMDIDKEIDALKRALAACHTPVIMVSNEVGMGLVPENPLARRFRDLQGILNQSLAKVCHNVIFVAAGLGIILKGSMT